jgi:CubicO group peptidase (beta-lactamase class C family)
MDDLDACVRQQMERWGVPGAAVGVLLDGAREVRGYGLASLSTCRQVGTETRFRIASVSKPFTATLAMTLVEQGKVGLDVPVAAYIPDLRLADERARRGITLRHLLSHRSGLFRDFDEDHGPGDDALRKAVARFVGLRRVTAPGEMWSYSNAGYHLAGAAIARALGTAFESAMQERVLGPLGLGRTGYFARGSAASPLAEGHTRGADGRYAVYRGRPYPRNRNPAGGLFSTAGDLLGFAALHLGEDAAGVGRVLSGASVHAMQEPQVRVDSEREWGLGWELRSVGGTRVVGHDGGVNGYAARLTLVPEKGFALAVLTNAERGDAAIRQIERKVLEACCALEIEDPTVVELPPKSLARVAGAYRRPGADVLFTVEGSSLRLDETEKDPLSGEERALPPAFLRPVTDCEFVATEGEDEGWRVVFHLGGDGIPRFAEMGYALAERVG